MAAWPFVVVILMQVAVAGFSVYTLSAIRAFVTGESLWSKGQHEAVYFLDRYLDTGKPEYLDSFRRTIAVPLAYRKGRQSIESESPDLAAAGRAFVAAGSSAEDVPAALWMFRHFRGFPYFEAALARWNEADRYIVELDRLAAAVGPSPATDEDAASRRRRVEAIDLAITPRTIAFAHALDDCARVVERILLLANVLLGGLLAALTIWRVGKVMKQRRKYEDALAWQASHDELTGTANRRAFEDRLRRAIASMREDSRLRCSVMFLDLDQFKIINDTCGHAAGDSMLRQIGPIAQKMLGPEDFLARLGGDEFGILLQSTDLARAAGIAECIRAAVERIDFAWQGRRFAVTASIGLAHDHAGSTTAEEMMSRADLACLMAKEKGRNRVHSHRDEDGELRGRLREMNWVQRIQQALDEDRFCLYAQEIVSLSKPDAGMRLEVLIRLRDESGLLVPPSSFLPAAERFGLMKLVDRWVVHQAFRTLAERRSIEGATPIACCGINLSGATIGDDAFLEFLKGAFAEFGISPRTICFEVTETAAIVNLEAARSFIGELQRLGCTFALDDFGSGMSSFNYLRELPVEFLKIDGTFVRNLLTERPDRAMVEMINHVGHVMGMRIVAEFVETDELADALRDIGVDYAQGFGIARPKLFTAQFDNPNRRAVAVASEKRRLIA